MSIKPRYKRRILWSIVSAIGVLILAVFILPPMITLNSLKPKIENAVFNQTGIPVKIHGDINFSLLGKTTIVAHNISLEKGFVSSCEFAIPLSALFDLENANISGDIYVNGASLSVDKIVPFEMNTKIILNNSEIKFLHKTYDIISANLSKQFVHAIVRTDQHKYEIESINNNFIIKNKNNDLNLSGTLFSDGSANAHISITAQNINRWFEFESPKITGRFPVTADMKWNGSYGIDFTNISANGVSGDAILKEDGYKIINLKSESADYDMSFILKEPSVLQNANLNLDFYGKIKFIDKTFKHLHIDIVGDKEKVKIKKVIADDLTIKNGYIDKDGAHDLEISLPENGIKTTCLFNGTPNVWSCNSFSYGEHINGEIHVNKNEFSVNVFSNYNLDDISKLVNSARRFGNIGIIKFVFANMAGTIKVNSKNYSVEYQFANNKNLKWAKIDLPFLPDFMMNENGDFVWTGETVAFVPKSQNWYLSINKDKFTLGGDNLKRWLKNIDIKTIVDLPYMISGNYKNGNISDLDIEIMKQKFTGSAAGKNITLKTDMLNIDAFLSQNYTNNYEQMSFFVSHPITIPFDLPINISLSANTFVYKGHAYNNFVYSSKENIQAFSITDSDRGSVLATIQKDKINYDINIQLNRFVWNGKILPNDMPLNLSDTMITAEIKLKTSGKIAHDLIENINGTFDASFDGGDLYGLGIADFYASAQNINLFNSGDTLAKALESGISPIKKMRIIGTYNNGDIKTTTPFTLSIKHSDITGTMEIQDNKMYAKMNLILRGTSADPKPMELIIEDNIRKYSLSEIDPEYMRTFIQTHNKF